MRSSTNWSRRLCAARKLRVAILICQPGDPCAFADYENVTITEPQDPDHPGLRTGVTIAFNRPTATSFRMTWWQNLRTLWPGALRQQVTRTGLAYSGAIVVVTLAAVLSANNLLFLILAAMLSILAISGFVSKLTLAGLEIDLLLPPHISARRTVRATVRLKNLKRWMPSFSIHVTGAPPAAPAQQRHPSGYDGALFFPAIPGGVALEEPIDLRFPTRGRYSERTFQLTTRFPFGFAERRENVTLRHEVIVYPCLEPRPRFQALADSLAGELEAWRRGPGHDFYRIRPYEALESARHVDWKATAHTRSLQVREFARDEDQMIVIYLDLDATPDQARLV